MSQYPLARNRKKADKVGTYWRVDDIRMFSDFSTYSNDDKSDEMNEDAVTELWKSWSRALTKDSPIPGPQDVIQRMVNVLCGTRDRAETPLERLTRLNKELVKEIASLKASYVAAAAKPGTTAEDKAKLVATIKDKQAQVKANQAEIESIINADLDAALADIGVIPLYLHT